MRCGFAVAALVAGAIASGLPGCADNSLPPAAVPTAAATSSPTVTPSPTPSSTPAETATPTSTPHAFASPTPSPTPSPQGVRPVPYDVGRPDPERQLTLYNSAPSGGSVGMPIAMGDVDGDGFVDFVLCPMLADGGPARERRDAGEVHIYYGDGRISGVRVAGTEGVPLTTIRGARRGDVLGTKVHVEDVDGDGRADVLVGAQNHDGLDGRRRNAGAAYLYRGRSSRPAVVDLATIGPEDDVKVVLGAAEGDRLGIWVEAGDLDGDGATDLVLGADQADGPDGGRSDAGAVYVLFGAATLPPVVDLAEPGAVPLAVIHGVDPQDHFGSTLLVYDFDGDGQEDLAAAAAVARGSSQIKGDFLAGGDGPDNTRPDAGEVHVLFGPIHPGDRIDLAAAPPSGVVVHGADASDAAGEELAAGDLDGDGRTDLVVGSLQAEGPPGATIFRGSTTGRTYILFDIAGRAGTTIDLADPGPRTTIIYGRLRGGISGDTLVVADMDGDGIDDLWDASPGQGTRDAAGVFRPASGLLDVVFGMRAWPAAIDLVLPPDGVRMVQVRGADPNDQFAYGLAVADANGDGRLDLGINAMTGDGFGNAVLDAGEMYVLDNQVLFAPAADPPPPLFLNLDIQPILETACLPCHGGPEPAAGLALDTVQESIEHLLGEDGTGAPSSQVDGLLVVPGDPAASYLVEKIAAGEGRPPRVGEPMPPPPATPLPERVIEKIRRWIAGGASAANEPLPPPPPPPGPPPRGFASTFFARIRFVLADDALGTIEMSLSDPPGPMPVRLIGPQLTVPAAEASPITLPEGAFGSVDVEIREDGTGFLDRGTGEARLDITFTQIALQGTVEIRLPVALSTGSVADGPFAAEGLPLDPQTGELRLVGVGRIPGDSPVVGGDPVLVELDGRLDPLPPPVPRLRDEIQAVFDQSCALANCHVGDGAAGLALEAGRSFAELVEVPSTQVAADLVVPGDPEASYLFEKIASARPAVGDRMPVGGELDPLLVEAIRQWILGGAPQ